MSDAKPMSAERRAEIYGDRFTPAQRRRALHKANHALALVEPERSHWWQLWKRVRVSWRENQRIRQRIASAPSNTRRDQMRLAWAIREQQQRPR